MIVSALALVVLALYSRNLLSAPVYLTPDEVIIALDAHSIASTAHDLRGRFLPLYFQITEFSEVIWYQPTIMYLSALFLKLLPLSEVSIRLPAVFVALLDVVVMFFLARTLFKRDGLALFAAVALALSPAHFIHGRFGMDYIYPLPFIAAWLLCLTRYTERHDARLLFAATTCLGIGFYSYIASVMMMPLYLGLTWLLLYLTQAPARHYGVAAAGFGWPLLPFLVWLLQHPTAYSDTVARYAIYNSKQLNSLQGAREFLNYTSLSERMRLYWEYFSPSFLFFNGGSQLVFSTRHVGVFLLPLAVLLPIGIYRAAATRRTPLNLVILLGFLSAPLAALVLDESSAINRAMALLPFSILLATLGMEYVWTEPIRRPIRHIYVILGATAVGIGAAYAGWTLLTQSRLTGSSLPLILLGMAIYVGGLICERTKRCRVIAACLVILLVVQFHSFYVDYFGDYRMRSWLWFQRNIRGGLEELIGQDLREHVPAVYLSNDIRWIDLYWKLYLIKDDDEGALDRTVQFDSLDVNTMARGSLVLMRTSDPKADAIAEPLIKSGELKRVRVIFEPDETPSFVVLQR